MTFPALFLRIKAMLIDSTIFGLLLFTLAVLSAELGITGAVYKVAFVVLPLILFEPFLIWTTGGSIGHHFSGIRIVGKTSGKNLFILNGIVRLVSKLGLGIFSLASMFITKRHQSIHDVLSHSLVVFKNEATAPARHKLKQQETDYVTKKPSYIRRLVVIAAYSVISWVVLSFITFFAVPQDCLQKARCTEIEGMTVSAVGIMFLVSLVLILVLGFLCKLPGAFFRRKLPTETIS